MYTYILFTSPWIDSQTHYDLLVTRFMCLFVCLYTYVQIYLLPCISSVLHTSCEIHTCKVMTANENADKKFQKVLPVCTDDGTYSPIQQLDNGTRVCVDAFGEAVQLVPPSGKCSEWILFYYFCGDVAILFSSSTLAWGGSAFQLFANVETLEVFL